jgi:hypothetical protein
MFETSGSYFGRFSNLFPTNSNLNLKSSYANPRLQTILFSLSLSSSLADREKKRELL